MKDYYYDLHMHSSLSPCADDDNTPCNLVGMAMLSGINIIALTDHNSTRNCPAFFEAARRYGIIPIAGMEITTSEEIHAVCLFETLDSAMRFGELIESRLFPVKNRPDLFGRQLVMDGEDRVTGEVDVLLSNATSVSIEELAELTAGFGGIAYPAHIDRESNGIIAVLGTLPENLPFPAVEFNREEKIEEYKERYKIGDKLVLVSSDAHCLTDVRDAHAFVSLPDGLESESDVVKAFFELMRSHL